MVTGNTLTWSPSKLDQYAGVIIEKHNGTTWQPVAEYGASYDPGYHVMEENQVYRVKSLWYTQKLSNGKYGGVISEFLEKGTFVNNTTFLPGITTNAVNIVDFSSKNIFSRQIASATVSKQTYLPLLLTYSTDMHQETLSRKVASAKYAEFKRFTGRTANADATSVTCETVAGRKIIYTTNTINRVDGISYTQV